MQITVPVPVTCPHCAIAITVETERLALMLARLHQERQHENVSRETLESV